MFQTSSSGLSRGLSSAALPRSASPASSALRRHRDSTVIAYAKDVNHFIGVYGGSIPCTADDLIRYILLSVKRLAPVTLARRCIAIQDAHRRAGYVSPITDPRLREALRALTAGQLPRNLLKSPGHTGVTADIPERSQTTRVMAPVTRQLLLQVFETMNAGLRPQDYRDRMVLLLGFAGLKRGEICGLNIEDLTFTDSALCVKLRHDDERSITLPFSRRPLCAATACQDWLGHHGLVGRTGPLVLRLSRLGKPMPGERLDTAYVSSIVKRRLKAAGVEDVSSYSAESLRKGHLAKSTKRRPL